MALSKIKKGDLCFVIMPFGGYFDSYYDNIYSQAILHCGLTPARADDLYRPSNIVQDIWNYTKKAKIVLADLTGKNSNVFYELGLAHALTKPAIIVAQNLSDIPFDLRSLRTIEYNKDDSKWGDILMEKIEKAIREVMASPQASIPNFFLETTVKRRKSIRKKISGSEKNKSIENTVKRKPNSAFSDPVTPSADLAIIVGSSPQTRTDITKKVWEYIKKNKLQDSKERRNINADANLLRVFGGKKTVSMFEMAKHINKHII